jgi:hypothetical protein
MDPVVAGFAIHRGSEWHMTARRFNCRDCGEKVRNAPDVVSSSLTLCGKPESASRKQ